MSAGLGMGMFKSTSRRRMPGAWLILAAILLELAVGFMPGSEFPALGPGRAAAAEAAQPASARDPQGLWARPEGWSRERFLGDVALGSERIGAAAGPGDVIYAAWSSGSGADELGVYLGIVRHGTLVGEPLLLSTRSPGAYTDPAVAVGPDGRVHVAWESKRGQSYELMYASVSPEGTVDVPGTVIISGDGPMKAISMAAKPGGVDIVWSDWRFRGYEIYHMSVDVAADGSKIRVSPDHQLTASDTTSSEPLILAGPDGRRHLLWLEKKDNVSDVMHGILVSDAAGTRVEDAAVIGHGTRLREDYLAAAVDSEGMLHVVWAATVSEGGLRPEDIDLYYTRLGPDGTVMVPPTPVVTGPGIALRPAIAAGKGGVLHLAWVEDTTGTAKVYYKTLAFSGTAKMEIGKAVCLDTSSRASLMPRLVSTSDGHVHVMTLRFAEGGRGYKLYTMNDQFPEPPSLWWRVGLDEASPLWDIAFKLAVDLGLAALYTGMNGGLVIAGMLFIEVLRRLGLKRRLDRTPAVLGLLTIAFMYLLEETVLFAARPRFIGTGFEYMTAALATASTFAMMRILKNRWWHETLGHMSLAGLWVYWQMFFGLLVNLILQGRGLPL